MGIKKEMHSSVRYIAGSGNCSSGLAVVGEAGGEQESIEGRPFCGRAGKLLDKMLDYIGLNRENVYVTNVVKVRPTDYGVDDKYHNRTPVDEELESWKPSLFEELEKIKPKVILALGGCAAKTLLEKEEGITKLRGKSYYFGAGWKPGTFANLVATYHPAYLLRKSGDAKINKQVKEDLKLVQKLLNS